MGLPAKLDLTLYRGDTRVWTVDLADGAGVALNVTGRTWLSQIRDDRNRGEIVATIDVDDADAATGRLVCTLTATEADALPGEVEGGEPVVLQWDLQSTDAGVVQTYLSGKVKVRGDVSDV